MDKLLTKIEELTIHEGLEPETITLLKMAAEAQRTGKMPPLPISMQPLPDANMGAAVVGARYSLANGKTLEHGICELNERGLATAPQRPDLD